MKNKIGGFEVLGESFNGGICRNELKSRERKEAGKEREGAWKSVYSEERERRREGCLDVKSLKVRVIGYNRYTPSYCASFLLALFFFSFFFFLFGVNDMSRVLKTVRKNWSDPNQMYEHKPNVRALNYSTCVADLKISFSPENKCNWLKRVN